MSYVLNSVKPQGQHLKFVSNTISRVVMFVGVRIFEGVAIKIRRLVFKSINIHKKQKNLWN